MLKQEVDLEVAEVNICVKVWFKRLSGLGIFLVEFQGNGMDLEIYWGNTIFKYVKDFKFGDDEVD